MTVKTLLKLDAIGAMISVIMLGVVLVHLESYFGIPKQVLYVLASIPVAFFVFDLVSCFAHNDVQPRLLNVIGIMNLLYCILSVTMAIIHRESLTTFGWIYIIVEILIVMLLARTEIKVGKRHLSTT